MTLRSSALSEGFYNLIAKRLDQIGEHGPFVGLEKGLNWHSRHKSEIPKPRSLVRIGCDMNEVVACPRPLILGEIGGNKIHFSVNLRRGALVEGGKAQKRHLPE